MNFGSNGSATVDGIGSSLTATLNLGRGGLYPDFQ